METGGSQGCPAGLSASAFGDQAMVPLPTIREPCTGRGPAYGPVASAESPERARLWPASAEPSQLERSSFRSAAGLPGALAAHSFLLRHSALITQLCCSPAPGPASALLLPFPQTLLPGSKAPVAACFWRGPGALDWAPCHSRLQRTSPCCYQFLLTGRLGSRPWEWLRGSAAETASSAELSGRG